MTRQQVNKAALLFKRFTGNSPESLGKIDIAPLPKAVAVIGMCDGILYHTVRNNRKESYIHEFRAKDKPLFAVSPDGKQILLIGGNYKFTERGIVDRTDPSNLKRGRR